MQMLLQHGNTNPLIQKTTRKMKIQKNKHS